MSVNGNGHAAELGIFATEETQRIYLEGTTHWVEIKRELDLGEESELEASALRGIEREVLEAGAYATNKALTVIDLAKQRILKLALYIVAWSFRDERGRPVDIPLALHERMELMKRLRPTWGNKLLEEIDRLREEDAKAVEEAGELDPSIEPDGPKAMTSGVVIDATPSSPSAGSSPAGPPQW